MKNTISSILRFDLCPISEDTKGDDYYSPEFRKLGTAKKNFIPHFEISFPAPILSAKVEYYKRLIDNDIITNLNSLFGLLQGKGTNLILFYRKKLYERIKSILEEIKTIIDRNRYDLNLILSPEADFSVDSQHHECTYIFNYLITALIRCYMEFQSHFLEHIENDKRKTIADFYVRILKKPLPSEIFIKEVEAAKVESEPRQTVEKEAKSDEENLSFTYTKLSTGSTNITDLMDSLKKENRIAKDTNSTDFRHVFTGTKVENPVHWTGLKSELSYLIKLLNNTHKVLTSPGNSVWKVVSSCFVDKEGNPFDADSLRDQKIPKSTMKEIEKTAALMK